jgi:hypothetical protein
VAPLFGAISVLLNLIKIYFATLADYGTKLALSLCPVGCSNIAVKEQH